MPLQESSTEIPLSYGLDQASNAEGDAAGWLSLENACWEDTNAVARRPGFHRVATWTRSKEHGLITAGNKLLVGYKTYLDGQGLLVNGSPAAGTALFPTTQRNIATIWEGRNVITCDSSVDITRGRMLVVFGNSDTNLAGTSMLSVSWQVIDIPTGTVLSRGDTGNAGTAFHSPRCGWAAGFFYLAYVEGVAGSCVLHTVKINPATGQSFTPVTQSSTMQANGQAQSIDMCGDPSGQGAYLWLAWSEASGGGGQVKLKEIISGLTATDALSLFDGNAHPIAVAHGNGNGKVTALYVDQTDNVQVTEFNDTTGAVLNRTIGGTPIVAAGPTIGKLGVVGVSATSARLVIEVDDDVIARDYVDATHFTAGLGAMLWARLMAKPFLKNGTEVAVGVATTSTTISGGTFPGAQIVDDSSNVIGVWGLDEASRSQVALPSVNLYGQQNLNISAPLNFSARVVALLVSETADISRARLIEWNAAHDAAFTNQLLRSTEINGVAYIAGGALKLWSGASVQAAAFSGQPEKPSLSSGAGSLTGTFAYVLVNEFADDAGNIQVSPPSQASTFAAAGTGITVELHFSNADGAGQPDALHDVHARRAKLYRTGTDGINFHLLREWIPNDNTETFVDNTPNADVDVGELLYTTGGALDSELAPPLSSITTFRNRLVGVRSDSPRELLFTTETEDATIPRWNVVLQARVDNSGGDPVAVAQMDDKLLVLQEDQICMITGEGPDGTGAGAFSLPEVVARNAGVTAANRNSVVEVGGLGVFFRHRTGIKMLQRDLQLNDIGLPIQRTLGNTDVINARFLPSLHQVWFILNPAQSANPPILVYDTRYGRWSSYTAAWGSAPIDVAEVNGKVYILDAYGADGGTANLYQVVVGSWVDKHDGTTETYFPRVLDQPWFRGAGRDGEMRLRRVGLVGQVRDAADQSIVTVDVFTQQPELRHAKNAETADNTYTFPHVAYPAGGLRLVARLVTQRCSALRLRITDHAPESPVGSVDHESPRWTAIAYEFGASGSRGRSPAGNDPAAT